MRKYMQENFWECVSITALTILLLLGLMMVKSFLVVVAFITLYDLISN